MKEKYTRESSILLLIRKQDALKAAGLSRYPQRSDFENEEVCAIKAFLGPWPRALEAAGLKPPACDGREQRKAEKRIRARRRQIEFLKQTKKEQKQKKQEENENAREPK